MPTHKENFLNYGIKSYQLKAKDIDILIQHYAQKGIILIKNGKRSALLIEEKKANIQTIITELEDDSKKYAIYLQMHFLPPGMVKNDEFCISNICGTLFYKEYNKLINSIKEFLTPQNEIKTDLSLYELIELNKICSRQTYKPLFDRQIAFNIQDLKVKINDACLTKAEAMQEVKKIRNELKEDESIGYIFTNNTQLGPQHFEVLIITPHSIIKPILWPDMARYISTTILDQDVKEDIPMYQTDLSFFTEHSAVPVPQPQADKTSCGILGIAYLKKLLKNQALALKSLTLCCSFYHHNNQKKHFFLPAPAVLCYAQSSAYILFLEKIMQSENNINGNQKILTLQGLLARSLQIAKKNNDRLMLEHNENSLLRLTAMRETWLANCAAVKNKREKMQFVSSEHNLYLAYTSHRMKNLVCKNASCSEQKLPLEMQTSFFKSASDNASKTVGINAENMDDNYFSFI